MSYICSLASGSGGNALVLSHGSTHILLDAGISCLRIKKGLAQLGLAPEKLSAVLITHPHSDHVSGLGTFSRQFSVPIYAELAAAETLAQQNPSLTPRFRCFSAGDAFEVGELLIQSFSTSHDAAGCVDYRIGILIGVVFFVAYLLTQYVSLGSVLAATAFGVGFVLFHHDNPWVWLCGVLMAALTLFAHRGNILRLIKGQERKTNLFAKGKSE